MNDTSPEIARMMREKMMALGKLAAVARAQEQSARPAVDVAVLLAGAAHGRRVDDRQQLHEVLDQETVEQGLVAVLEDGQPDVLLQVVSLGSQVFQLQGDLLLNRQGCRGHQAVQIELIALLRGEGRSLVEQRVAEQLRAAVAGEGRCLKMSVRKCGLFA